MYIAEIGWQTAVPAPQTESPAAEEAGSITMQEAIAAAAPNPAELGRDEYRSYIAGRISALPIHPSQSMASISVHISDAGLQAMQADPEYEAWVLDSLAYDFAFNDVWGPLCGGSYHVHSFGATKEDYHGEGWFSGYAGGQGASLYETKSAGSLWQRNTQKRPAAGNKYADFAARLRLERLLRKMALDRKDLQSELLASASQRRALIEAQNRSGHVRAMPSAPLPQLKGVSAADLLAALGGGL